MKNSRDKISGFESEEQIPRVQPERDEFREKRYDAEGDAALEQWYSASEQSHDPMRTSNVDFSLEQRRLERRHH